jgi:hypothetical protein
MRAMADESTDKAWAWLFDVELAHARHHVEYLARLVTKSDDLRPFGAEVSAVRDRLRAMTLSFDYGDNEDDWPPLPE